MTALEAGAKAPDFELDSAGGGAVSLADLLEEGKYAVLAFFPAAWSSTCGDQMSMYQEFLDEFAALKAKVVGISVDNAHSTEAWAESKGITFPLLADFHPKGAVATQYGVMREDGISERALFIVDGEGVIRHSYVSPIAENPGVDGLFAALEGLGQGGE